jgi:hypothetical protein
MTVLADALNHFQYGPGTAERQEKTPCFLTPLSAVKVAV